MLELRLVSDIAGKFRVPRYQRGYRWGEVEVTRLLNDVRDSQGEPYCLQPIVVKREGDAAWELIDGQQRLTTLHLIFAYMQRAGFKNIVPQYFIQYDTRPQTEDYLVELDQERAGDNIDFFHLSGAYASIETWFAQNGATANSRQDLADDIFRFLRRSVRVIWYEAPEEMDSTTLFTRLNVGKIPLTDAELFKALLLSRSGNGAGTTNRIDEIAAQWDGVERDLRHPDIWAFVASGAAAASPTRITLLLDALAGGPLGRMRPRFHTFDVLRSKVEESGPAAVWEDVIQLHATVLGWYEDRDLYHKIGYLIAIGHRVNELVALASRQSKSAFGALLDARISSTLDLTPSGVASLSYDANMDKCTRVLLLMNIETIRQMKDSTERYSFRVHGKQDWSLEHIHAQHAETLTKADQWKEWLRLHRGALAQLPGVDQTQRDELLRQIDDVPDDVDRQTFQRLARDIAAVFTLVDAGAHSAHALSNLALLSSGHNSALSNAVFEVKRQRIIALDRQGAHIPICTRQVFLKYYTAADAQQIHFWSAQDRGAYMQAILSDAGGVGGYLKPEMPLP